ncbi:MAG TPA: TadE/TadG family type IV pilus assembly protein [Terracidiphilus sp.]|nr:TadE/TadG family type IV pilus assembly protein [Terracidiphilus sp.]
MFSGKFRRQLKWALLREFKRDARDERGQTLVETALSMMVMLTLIFAVIEACWGVYAFHYLGSITHEAARYAIVRGSSWSATCDGSGSAGSGYGSSMCTASTSDIGNYVANRDFPGLNITASDVCVEYLTSVPSSASQNCTASTGSVLANAPGDIVQVTITYPFTLVIPGLSDHTFHLMSTSQMVIAQ